MIRVVQAVLYYLKLSDCYCYCSMTFDSGFVQVGSVLLKETGDW